MLVHAVDSKSLETPVYYSNFFTYYQTRRVALTALSRDICQFLGQVRKARVGVGPNKSLYVPKNKILC